MDDERRRRRPTDHVVNLNDDREPQVNEVTVSALSTDMLSNFETAFRLLYDKRNAFTIYNLLNRDAL